MIIIVALVAGIVFAFLMMNVIGQVQEAVEPALTTNQWISGEMYMIYYYANAFITNLWTYLVVIVFLVLAYWVYHYTQRKGAGYY